MSEKASPKVRHKRTLLHFEPEGAIFDFKQSAEYRVLDDEARQLLGQYPYFYLYHHYHKALFREFVYPMLKEMSPHNGIESRVQTMNRYRHWLYEDQETTFEPHPFGGDSLMGIRVFDGFRIETVDLGDDAKHLRGHFYAYVPNPASLGRVRMAFRAQYDDLCQVYPGGRPVGRKSGETKSRPFYDAELYIVTFNDIDINDSKLTEDDLLLPEHIIPIPMTSTDFRHAFRMLDQLEQS